MFTRIVIHFDILFLGQRLLHRAAHLNGLAHAVKGEKVRKDFEYFIGVPGHLANWVRASHDELLEV